jgi:hypothetical protein
MVLFADACARRETAACATQSTRRSSMPVYASALEVVVIARRLYK